MLHLELQEFLAQLIDVLLLNFSFNPTELYQFENEDYSKKRKEVEYIGYTYKNDEDEEEDDDYCSVIEILDNIKNKENSENIKTNNSDSNNLDEDIKDISKKKDKSKV